MAREKTMNARKLFWMESELAQEIEDYRFAQRIGSESEAIRRLVKAGLASKDARKPAPAHESQPKRKGKTVAARVTKGDGVAAWGPSPSRRSALP